MRTEIATLGEFGLIDRLTEGIKLENESSKYGVGDDAAVLSYPSEKQVLVTTDLLMEGVHFDLNPYCKTLRLWPFDKMLVPCGRTPKDTGGASHDR